MDTMRTKGETEMGINCGTILAALMAATAAVAEAEPWKMFDRRLGMFVHWGIYSAGE